MYWIEPPGFAHPIDIGESLAGDPPDLSRPTQAKLNAPFNDGAVPTAELKFADRAVTCWSSKEVLFLTNRGSEEQKDRGFHYCLRCGRIEPQGWQSQEAKLGKGGDHLKPYPNHQNQPRCSGFTRTVCLGTRFVSDVSLFRFQFGDGVLLPPGSSLARICLTTIAQALGIVAADMLETDRANIGAEYRTAQTAKGSSGAEVDVYLYDTTPGGAGFVKEAIKDPERLIRDALAVLERCDCTGSCYRCLRSYSNRFLHPDLDRSLGAAMCRHILGLEKRPQLEPHQEDVLLRVLERDLIDSGETVQFKNGYLVLPARNQRRIVLAHALSPSLPGSARAESAMFSGSNNAYPIDHLRVERALPAAIADCLGAAASSSSTKRRLPDGVTAAPGGCPIHTVKTLEGGWPAVPIEEVALEFSPDATRNLFLFEIEGPQLEKLRIPVGKLEVSLQQGKFLVMERREEVASQVLHDKKLLLIRSQTELFNATRQKVTFAKCQWVTFDGNVSIRVQYASTDSRAVVQKVDPAAIQILGQPVGLIQQGRFHPVQFP